MDCFRKNGSALILFTLMVSRFTYADPLATRIIRNGEKTLRGKSSQALMTMSIYRPDYTREMKLRAWTSGNKKALVEILAPAKEEAISSLRISNQMWNYLPKTDQTIRVPMSLMLQSWMGSDFTNDDLTKASSLQKDYTHRILKKDSKQVVVECRPKKEAPVVWGKILHTARLSDYLPIWQQYFDEHGRLVRTIRFDRFRKMDDRIIPTRVTVVNAENRHDKTVIRYRRILYDRRIAKNLFSRDRLRVTAQLGKSIRWGWSTEPLRPQSRKAFFAMNAPYSPLVHR